MEIKGKLALVTGASRGIGAATAMKLAEAGANLILVARSERELAGIAEKIEEFGTKVSWWSADLSDLDSIESFVKEVLDEFDAPDIIINNAGLGRWLFAEETPGSEAEMMTKLPFQAAFHITRLFLPKMLERKSGHIVNVNSPASVLAWGGASAYISSRWALRGFSESLKIDLNGTGVGISHVVLGEVESNYWEANPGARERLPSIGKLIPKISPSQAAVHILNAIRRNKKEYTRPIMLWIFRRLLWFSPGLVKWLVAKTSFTRT